MWSILQPSELLKETSRQTQGHQKEGVYNVRQNVREWLRFKNAYEESARRYR